jgi:hypothetical protein
VGRKADKLIRSAEVLHFCYVMNAICWRSLFEAKNVKALYGVSLSLLFLLSGCSGLSESDCLAVDWQQIGLEDGQKGEDVSEANRFYGGCGKHGIEVDLDAYETGRNEGLRTFCQAENGFEAGKSGYQYAGVCPSDLAGDFLAEYEIGVRFYYVYRDISAIESTISGNLDTIGKLERGISTATLQLASDDLSIREETELQQNIRSMESQIKEYERTSLQLQGALLQRQGDLQELKGLYRK